MNNTEHNKKAMLTALENTLGIVTTACKQAGIGRTQFYNWLKEDEDFAAQVKDIENIALDFVESQLYRQIRENNTAATIFYLKTKAKNRGYTERTEITGADGEGFSPIHIILPKNPNE
jgi:hypothetical protein